MSVSTNNNMSNDGYSASKTVAQDVGGAQGVVETSALESGGMVSKVAAHTTGGHVYALTDILLRDQLIGTGTVSTANAFETIVLNIDPWQALLATGQTQNFLNNYHGIRGDLVVTLVTNFPAGCYGLYSMVATPVCDAPYNGGVVRRLDTVGFAFTARHGIHAMLDCARSNSVQLTLPFIWPEEFMQVDGGAGGYGTMYEVRLQALQPLKNIANESFTSAITLFARLEPGYALINPKYQSGKPSSYARTMAAGLNAGADVLDAFGFTKDAVSDPPTSSALKLYSNPSTVDGFDASESTSLRSAPFVSSSAEYGGASDTDEAEYSALFQHWTLVNEIPWGVADLVGKYLGVVPVTPCLTRRVTGFTPSDFAVELSPAGFVGLVFEHWRGGMEYEVRIPVSAFHRGAVQVIWNEEPVTSFPVDPTGRSLNAIMDISLGTTFQLGVDYASHWPCLDCVITSPPMASAFGTTPTSVDVHPSWTNGYLSFRVLQRLVCSTNAGSAADTNILVFARAKPDMRFGVPRQTLSCIKYGGVVNTTGFKKGNLRSSVRFQVGGTIGDVDPEIIYTQLVSANVHAEKATEVLWGDDVRSVRALMQRFSRLGTTTTIGALAAGGNGPYYLSRTADQGSAFSYIPTAIPAPSIEGSSDAVKVVVLQNAVNVDTGSESEMYQSHVAFTWAGYFSMLFAGVRSSVRTKVERIYGPEGLCYAGQVAYWGLALPAAVNNANEIDPSSNTIGTQQNLAPQPLTAYAGAEFVTPYGDPHYFRVPQIQRSLNGVYSAEVGTMLTTTVNSGLTASEVRVAYDAVSVAYGPDVTPMIFRRVPFVALSFTTSPF